MNRHVIWSLRRHHHATGCAQATRRPLASTTMTIATRIETPPTSTSISNRLLDQHQRRQQRRTTPSSWMGIIMPVSRRHASSDRRLQRNPKGKLDPFLVLKVRRSTPYAQVKQIFLRTAMLHHPDVLQGKSEEDQNKSREIFIRARQAFEALVKDETTGGICLREELPNYVADDEHDKMDQWFKQETGHEMPFMDEETMKEVAAMTEQLGGGGMDRGLDRDGGMWELARMVTRTVMSGGDGKNLLRLEAGDIKENEINDANLRAKRRRNRNNR
jgi:hypothetical protein